VIVFPAAGSDAPPVGRDQELARLHVLVESVAAGDGSALLIEGAAGMGKSALVRAAARTGERSGLHVLSARAIATERDFPYGVAIALFERALAPAGSSERAAQFAGAAELVSPLFRGLPVADGERSTFAMLHGLFWLAVNLAQSRPLLLCVDDLHAADEGSLGFLAHLTARLDELPIGLVAATRPPAGEEHDPALATVRAELGRNRLTLSALPAAAVAEIVRARMSDADDELVAVCADVTKGNPYYIHEMLRALADDAPVPSADLGQRLRDVGFATISRAALFRLGRLGSSAIALARALAVLGDGSQLRLVAALAEVRPDVAARTADLLVAEEIVMAGRALEFVHPLIGQSIEQELAPQQRGRLHLRAARLLSSEGAAASLVAAHLVRAPAAADPWVVEVLRASAEHARRGGLPAVAVRELSRALEEPPQAEQRPLVLAELGAAELAAGAPGAVEHLTQATELHSGAERVALQRTLARALAAQGNRLGAAKVLEAALDEVALSAPALEDEVISDYLVNSMFDPGSRQRAVRRTARLQRSVPGGRTAAERSLLAAMALRSAQDAEGARRSAALARRAWHDGDLLDDQGVDGTGWLMVVWAYQLCDELQAAAHVASTVLQRARESSSIDAFASASYTRGRTEFDLGRLNEAQADIEQTIAAGESGWARFQETAYALCAIIQVERGELENAATSIDAVYRPDMVGGMERAWLAFARGRLELARNRPSDALLQFLRAGNWLSDELAVEHSALPWRDFAGRAAFAIGEPDRARKLAEPLAALGERAGLPVIRARGLRVLGLLEPGDVGIAMLREASALFGSAGAALDQAEVLIDIGARLRRGGDRAAARPPLATALDRAAALGAVRLAELARQELAAAGARPRTERRSGPDALTPSERRVARLAAEGLSNPQIAQALFVTPKTVEYHLRHAYQKLGITGRGGLSAALAEG
jgi:DNA-binding CsgD family transcriptional regulator